MSITTADVDHWRTWIDSREERSEILDRSALIRFAAAIGEPLDIDHGLPSLGHWAFFLPVAAADQIGVDGHPKRGGFLPPISLPRRMFAAADMEFGAPLILDWEATRTSHILDVVHKSGRSGDLVFVTVEHRIVQADEERMREVQTIVYRDAGAPMAAIEPTQVEQQADDRVWHPATPDLFRFSAVTFNSHRIHYDLPYTQQEEGYPGLVIHGPFTATRLFAHARRGDRTPRSFSFRAVAPLICGQDVLLREEAHGQCRAIRCDGADAMIATASY